MWIGVEVVDFEIEQSDLQWIRANIEELPFSDEFVDSVYSRSLREPVAHPERVFKEVCRVLRPDAFVGMIDE